MTIGLLNVYSTNNLGDAAIYSAIARMAPNNQALAHAGSASQLTAPGLVEVSSLRDCQSFVGVGGDIFNNARPKFITRTMLRNLMQLARRSRQTFVFGQSIPRSCRGPSFRLLAQVFRRLQGVMVRDQESFNRLRDADVPASLSFDVAFALEPHAGAEAAAAIAYAEQNLDPDRTALISLRGFDSMYPVEEVHFLERLAELAIALRERGHSPALLIQADAGPNDGDRQVVAQLQKLVPSIAVIDCFRPAGGMVGWPLLMGVCARARMVVAVRYHTAILRLCSGRVPFVLHYSNKGEDLARRLDLPAASACDFDPRALLPAIERSGEMAFEPRPIRSHVKQNFADCLSAVQAGR